MSITNEQVRQRTNNRKRMKSFSVTVRTSVRTYAYIAIAECSADVVDAAVDQFGLCSVFVMVSA